ncbi:MAG: 3-oxoadipate enol-lactonase [Deltaproteobacteria bacterium]|nr:MAG: 3-oxoadipate enol-lactonase [Deltaproteobacteria bacterium]
MKVEANGIQINYELSGKENAPTVVLSHSLGSSMEMWNPQMASLGSHYHLLRYDTRGHGGSEAPAGPYTLDQLGEDVIELLDLLNIETVHFVGLSMGGMIGQYLAINHANRLRSLALCDTAAIIAQEAQPVWQERIDTAREKGIQALAEATLERWFTPRYLQQNPPEVQLIRKLFLSTPLEGFIGCSEAIRSLDNLRFLSQIKTPTLIMVGADDPGTPVDASEEMHSRIHGSRLVVLSAAAHLSNVEQSSAFNQALLEFLNRY